MRIVLGALAGFGLIIFRVVEYRRFQSKVSELLGANNYQCLNYAGNSAILFGIMALLPLGCFIYSLTTTDQTLIAITLAFALMAIGELVNVLLNSKFYYNDTSFFHKDKVIRYKSIKVIFRRGGIPLGRYLVQTFNGEQYNLDKAPALKVLEKGKLKLANESR